MGYRGIAAEIGVNKNTVGPLVRDALRKRSRDRAGEAQIGGTIALKRQRSSTPRSPRRSARRSSTSCSCVATRSPNHPGRSLRAARGTCGPGCAYVSKAEGVLGALDLPKVAPEDGDTVYFSTSREDYE